MKPGVITSSARTTAELINQTSGDTEYYSPPKILAAARHVLGGIDLDPFSSEAANCHVQAKRYFTEADDGFAQDWLCWTLWANHPFGRENNPRFVEKLERAWLTGAIQDAALCITYACTSEEWFQPLMKYPQCFLSPRTNYYLPDGTLKRGVTKGSVVTYLGHDWGKFATTFRFFGTIKIAYHP